MERVVSDEKRRQKKLIAGHVSEWGNQWNAGKQQADRLVDTLLLRIAKSYSSINLTNLSYCIHGSVDNLIWV